MQPLKGSLSDKLTATGIRYLPMNKCELAFFSAWAFTPLDGQKPGSPSELDNLNNITQSICCCSSSL
jgi:hypothetical protein